MNVNVPVSTNHPQSYAIIQNAQPPIIASGPSAVTSLTGGQQQQQHQMPGGGGGDIHICGTCGAQFTEIKDFIGHKRQGCHEGGGGSLGLPQSQLSATSSVTQPQHPPGSVMGVPVGMPHVVLQTATGPPQVYRIVLEPSVAPAVSQGPPPSQAPGPILAQALSGTAPTQLASTPSQQHVVSTPNHHLTFTPSHHFASNSTQQPMPSTPSQHLSASGSSQHHLTTASAQQHLVTTSTQHSLSSTSTQQHTPSTSAQQHLAACHSQTHSATHACQVTQGSETWHSVQPLSEAPREREGGITVGNRTVMEGATSLEDSHQDNNDSPSVPTARGGRSGSRLEQLEGDDRSVSAATTMHTEEEDVATFLATQLASQAAPPHTTNVMSEHLMTNVVLPSGSEGDLAFTATTTTTTTQPQHQTIHLPLHHHHHQSTSADSLGNGVRGSVSGRRYSKASTPDPAAMNVDSKANILPVCPKERLVVHDGIHKEKTCPVKDCNFSTYHNKDLNRHIRKHTGEKPYQCEECGTSFSRGDKLKVHSRIHSNVRPYWCTETGCQYRAIDSGSLRKHMRTHTNERPYRCQLCPYSARDGSQLTVHLRTHTGDTPFQCMVDSCSAAFKTSSDLRRHERLHTGLKPYKCTACDYACAIKSNLTVHMRLNHFKGAKFSCTKCDFLGNSRKQLKDHEKSHANVLLQCELCEHVSTSNTGLRQHMLIHSQEKPFQCRYCSFTCKTTGNLRYHVRNKHGCEVFGRKRGGGSGGSGGMRGRGGTGLVLAGAGGRRAGRPSCYRNFKCGECGSGFVREDSYRSHMRQHEKHKMAQAISGKMEPDVFSVVVQDDGLMGVEQADGAGGSRGGGGGTVTTFQRIPSDPLQPGTLLPQTTVGGTSGTQNSENSVNGYSSYVITIDGISTVFSNPVRISGSTGSGESVDNGDHLSGTVQVITGDILASASPSSSTKVTTQQQNYDLSEDTKTHPPCGFELTQHDKISQTQHMYDLTAESKSEPGQTGFSETTGDNREYHTHPTSPQMTHTVLIEQSNIETNIDSSVQVHNLSAKPKSE